MHDTILVGGALDKAQRGGADRDQATAIFAYAVEPVCCRGINAAPLAVHAVACRIIDLYRQERARTHVQGKRRGFYARIVHCLHQFGGEMQGRSGGGDGAVLLREHRLIIFGVARIGRPLAGNIGRQRHCTCAM